MATFTELISESSESVSISGLTKFVKSNHVNTHDLKQFVIDLANGSDKSAGSFYSKYDKKYQASDFDTFDYIDGTDEINAVGKIIEALAVANKSAKLPASGNGEDDSWLTNHNFAEFVKKNRFDLSTVIILLDAAYNGPSSKVSEFISSFGLSLDEDEFFDGCEEPLNWLAKVLKLAK